MLNVTAQDLQNEIAVATKLKKVWFPNGADFLHNGSNSVATFDFDLIARDRWLGKFDVKFLYSMPFQYDENIFSIEKYQDYINRPKPSSYLMVYYYPQADFLRVYNLDKCEIAERQITIWHKRELVHKLCTVKTLKVAQKLFEIQKFSKYERKPALVEVKA